MTAMQKIEIEHYHNEITRDMRSLVEKYRRAMDWDVPENDDRESDRLIFAAVREALDQVESES